MAVDASAKRIISLQKLMKLQRQLQRLAEADLARVNRERGEVQIAMEELVDAMSGMSATHRLFPHLYARQLSNLKARDQVLAGQAEVHRGRIDTERKRGERVGERLDMANLESERHGDDEVLLDLLDAVRKETG